MKRSLGDVLAGKSSAPEYRWRTDAQTEWRPPEENAWRYGKPASAPKENQRPLSRRIAEVLLATSALQELLRRHPDWIHKFIHFFNR